MKKLLLISLAVLLAVSLSITMFPTQSVEASHKHRQGITFHIKAEGQGTFENKTQWPYEDGDGDFSVNLNGSGHFANYGRGLAWHGGGGYVKGSFDGREMNVALQVVRVEVKGSHSNYPDMPIRVHFTPKGLYDGVPIVYGYGYLAGNTYINGYWIKPDATEMKVVLNLKDKNDSWHHITIYMDEYADIFKVDIDVVGR